jgi:DNA-binding transcriptional MerR regulator
VKNMNNVWKPQHLTALYGIVLETARQWAMEFAEYLSPTGNPGKNKHRIFTDEDMRVFALIAEMKQRNATNEEVHVALKSGQRGTLPAMPAERVSALLTTDRERALAMQLAFVQQELFKVQEQIKSVDQVKQNLAQEREKNLIIQTRYEETKLNEEELRRQILDLTKQLGREYAEGYKAGLKDAREDENE